MLVPNFLIVMLILNSSKNQGCSSHYFMHTTKNLSSFGRMQIYTS